MPKPRKRRETFTAICNVELLKGILNCYRGIICYLPEKDFDVRDRVRVTVERIRGGKR